MAQIEHAACCLTSIATNAADLTIFAAGVTTWVHGIIFTNSEGGNDTIELSDADGTVLVLLRAGSSLSVSVDSHFLVDNGLQISSSTATSEDMRFYIFHSNCQGSA